MFTVTNVSRFTLAAAIAMACGVLLLSPSACPPPRVDHAPTQAADHSIMAAAAVTSTTPTPKDDLAMLLSKAAMEDNTVIMTFTNKAMTAPGSLLDLFLESFRAGDKTEHLLKHLVIVAMDSEALEQCKRVHPLCYRLDLGGGGTNFTAEKKFMSREYLEMMWARNKFQTHVMELGYAFLFSDVDIMWFRNPLLHVPVAADITISCDKYYGEDDPYGPKDANGGFLHAKPNAKTIGFFKGWYEARTAYPRRHDQYVFSKVVHELSVRHGTTVMFVDTAYFGSHCQPKKDFRRLCTFHANCLTGLNNKLELLRGMLGEWKHFTNHTSTRI